MPDELLQKQPEETPELAYADKWLQRVLTYLGLPAGVLFVILNQTYLAIACFIWLALAVGYAIIKQLRKTSPQTLALNTLEIMLVGDASIKKYKPSSNIVCLDSGITMLEETEEGVFVLGGQIKIKTKKSSVNIDAKPELLLAIAVELRNEPIVNKKVLPIKNVQAQVFYYSKGSEAPHRVHEGVWLGRKSALVGFEVGEKRDLILGIIGELGNSKHKYFTVCDNKKLPSGERLSMNYPLPYDLTAYVRLFNKKDGEIIKTLKFQLNCKEQRRNVKVNGREIEQTTYTYKSKCVGESELPIET
jgi:hypothetical protein